MITEWTADMAELFTDLLAEFGVTASYEGAPFDCIKTPVKSGFEMLPAGFNRQADTVIDMWRSVAVANGLFAIVQSNPTQKRPVVTVGERRFEVLKLENDDDTNPVIKLSCMQLQ